MVHTPFHEYAGYGVQLIAAAAIAAFGEWNLAVKTFLLMIAFDYATGWLSALRRGELNSRVGRIGIAKKFGYFIIVGTSYTLSQYMGVEGVRDIVIGMLIVNETTSILENVARLGKDDPGYLPDGIVSVFESLIDEKIHADDRNE